MLFILPFIVAAITLLSKWVPGHQIASVPVHGCIDIAFIHSLNETWQSVIGGVVMLGVAYMIFLISNIFKLLYQRTTLPSLLYILLTSGIMVSIGFNYLLIAVFIVGLAVACLQSAIYNTKNNASLFDFGALMMLAVAIYPKFVLLLIWALCAVLFSGRSTVKDVMALLVGFCAPVIFVVFYYYWTDSLAMLPGRFMTSLTIGNYIHHLPTVEIIRLCLLFMLLMVALLHFFLKYSAMMVYQRRGMTSLVSMLLFLIVTLVAVPGNYYDFMYMLAFPLVFIYSYYFIVQRVKMVNDLMFILLLCACFLSYFI